ncbi:hypothetical protein BDY17DRAFT_248225 [Neohortaea acidophila]|uniref:Cell wall biogenesis protein Mhp1 n=1 Tax=Neohortaea acidophila TaxID=245834 RepID=A0A6A6PWL0_9PEZI|nr:uncharacterized protein BDY17DRAFT_248225 [Neohortaea acidophila]KAF2484059.1 hypothetical protein BDY17DRAFT_248225 [Neohortaea acidophila]
MQPPKQTPSTPPTPNGLSNESAAAIAAETVGSPPLKQKDSSFFSSLKRTLSANSQTGGIPKMPGQGAPCARRVLNIDPNRERCNVPEMDSSRLRRVSFCVDVEIAGGPKYADEDDEDDKKSKKKDFKAKERAEGEALKHPEAIKEEKEKECEAVMENKVASNGLGPRDSTEDVSGSPDADGNDGDRDSAARKREKKKQSEIERKERKEKRRRRAEESGAIPVELPLDGDAGVSKAAAPANGAAPKGAANGTATAPKTPTQPQPHANSKQDRPTTDPVRIYRRCCQLRESPILKRITEQLMNPKCMQPDEPGVVHCLDLTGSRLQLADVVSLGDWLAVVPVKDLKLEDADLSDEGVRCILAGLLAAKRPGPTKRKSLTPRHREGIPFEPYQERSGVIEKITLKNNPRLTRVGWKHISLFLYMCRSLRAIDLSMNFFPETLPPSAQVTPIKSSQNNAPNGKPEELDAAEALYQCLSERLGGQKLEELIMSECGLSSAQIRKVVDGVMAVQVKRLGLAGNHLDDEGLEYVLEYVRSGMCQALDLGANDLRGKLGLIGEAIVATVREDRPCWGLCLAGCNLDTASLKPLLAQLVKLPSFKFMDLSHNPNLGSDDDSLMPLLGRYLGQLPEFKRLHLTDVNMSPSQAISLANILPECPLAHLNILENPQLTALANATTEADQEEACALYASLMAAVRVSGTLMCIDVDVPSAENSDIVKALAKQVVAYSLRNMETFAISEVTGAAPSMANATAALTAQHGGEKGVKEFAVPDVLMSLVGHVDGVPENHDHDDPAPDEDYIVGGTGVVKALQYVLGGERMTSTMSPTTTGANTPTRPTSSGGLVEPGKAKKMSKNLLSSARKIRDRLQPALMKESAAGGDEVQYRRLMFLDQTLQNIIERFEEEYPETRLAPPSPKPAASVRSSYTDQSTASASATTQATDVGTTGSEDDEEVLSGGDDEDRFDNTHLHHTSRQNSEVNIISRQQTREEGHLHRLGQKLRRDVLETPTSIDFQDVPWRRREEDERFRKVAEKIEDLDGRELRHLVTTNGWDEAIKKLGANVGDLRHLQEEDPEAWELFKEAQEKAILNRTGSVAE